MDAPTAAKTATAAVQRSTARSTRRSFFMGGDPAPANASGPPATAGAASDTGAATCCVATAPGGLAGTAG
ncbi:hypothetical protein ACFQ0G_27845 [Streptomyces chiangmaiensis]